MEEYRCQDPSCSCHKSDEPHPDTSRLDWVLANEAKVFVMEEQTRIFTRSNVAFVFDTDDPREAIDKAMEAQGA